MKTAIVKILSNLLCWAIAGQVGFTCVEVFTVHVPQLLFGTGQGHQTPWFWRHLSGGSVVTVSNPLKSILVIWAPPKTWSRFSSKKCGEKHWPIHNITTSPHGRREETCLEYCLCQGSAPHRSRPNVDRTCYQFLSSLKLSPIWWHIPTYQSHVLL